MLLTYKDETVEVAEGNPFGPLLADLIAEYRTAEDFAAKLRVANGDPDLLLRAAMVAEGKCIGLGAAVRAVILVNAEAGHELVPAA